MTEANYEVMKRSADKHRKAGLNWEQILAEMTNNDIILDTGLVQKMKKELYG